MALNSHSHSQSLYLIFSKSAAIHAIDKLLPELISRLEMYETLLYSQLVRAIFSQTASKRRSQNDTDSTSNFSTSITQEDQIRVASIKVTHHFFSYSDIWSGVQTRVSKEVIPVRHTSSDTTHTSSSSVLDPILSFFSR